MSAMRDLFILAGVGMILAAMGPLLLRRIMNGPNSFWLVSAISVVFLGIGLSVHSVLENRGSRDFWGTVISFAVCLAYCLWSYINEKLGWKNPFLRLVLGK